MPPPAKADAPRSWNPGYGAVAKDKIQKVLESLGQSKNVYHLLQNMKQL